MVDADMASTPATQPSAPHPRTPSEADTGGETALAPASPASPASPAPDPPPVPRPEPPAKSDLRPVELVIAGIPDRTSAARVAQQLAAIDRVTATIDPETGRALISAPPSISNEFLVAAVRSAGFHATLIGSGRRALPARADRRRAEARRLEARRLEERRLEALRADRADTHRDPPPPAHPRADDHLRDLRQRLVLALVLTVPVVALTTVVPLQFTHWQWITFALTAPVVTWAAYPFHRASAVGLARGAVVPELPASTGVLAAFGWSTYALLTGPAGAPGARQEPTLTVNQAAGSTTLYLEVAAVVTTVLLFARYAEARSRRRDAAAVQALLDLGASDVAALRDGREERLPVDRLAVGDLFVVRPGERFAVDGVVVEGRSVVDATRLLGAPTPTEVGLGDAVLGGSVNVGLPLIVRATHVGGGTQLARMVRLVNEAPEGTGTFPVIERLAAAFVPFLLLVAGGTLGWWLGGGASVATAIAAAVAVLVIAGPTAVVHMVPAALYAGAGRAAQFGILFRPRAVLRAGRRLDTVVLTKARTLTTGRTALLEVVAAPGERPEEALRLAGAVEYGVAHPIARAIAAGASDWVGALPPVRDQVLLPGRGIRGVVDREGGPDEVLVGRFALLAERGVALPDRLAEARLAAEHRGRTAVGVAWGGQARAVLAVGEEIQATSVQAVRQLRTRGLRTVMVTGDDSTVARALAKAVGVDEVIAEVPPSDKAEVVGWLRGKGRTVAMVADRDSEPEALRRADLGVAIGPVTGPIDPSHTDGDDPADVVLVRGDLRALVETVRLAGRIRGAVRRGATWALLYHLVALPPAVLGLVNPMLAAVAMTLSVLVAASFTARLHRFVPLPAHTAAARQQPELTA